MPYPWIHTDFDLVNKFQDIISHQQSVQINHFKACLEKLKSLQVDRSQNSILAHYLLFNLNQFPNAETLHEREKIVNISKQLQELIHPRFGLSDFVLNLRRMASTCSHILQPSSCPNIDVLWHEIDKSLTENKIQLYHSVWQQISPTFEYVERMKQLRMGNIQLRPSLHKEGQFLLLQRLHQIIYQSGQEMNGFDLQKALLQIHPRIALLQLIKVTTAFSFLDQIRLICGNDFMAKNQGSLQLWQHTSKTDVRDLLVAFKVIETESKFNAFRDLVRKLGFFLMDDDLYILTLLFIIFKNIQEVDNNRQNEIIYLILKKIESKYRTGNALETFNGFTEDFGAFEELFSNYMTF